jgi:hypothetical protein
MSNFTGFKLKSKTTSSSSSSSSEKSRLQSAYPLPNAVKQSYGVNFTRKQMTEEEYKFFFLYLFFS